MYQLKQYGLAIILIAMVQSSVGQNSPVTDSLAIFRERVSVARQNQNNNDIFRVYFENTFSINVAGIPPEDFQKLTAFVLEGINYASSIGDYKHLTIGYVRIAGIYRRLSEADKAIGFLQLAISIFRKHDSDSLKAVTYIELGDCYGTKSEQVEASKYFNIAYDLALKSEFHILESKVSHRIANLYYNNGDTAEAKRQLYKSVEINKLLKSGEALIEDYTALARVTDNVYYLDTVFIIADSLGLQHKTRRAKEYRFNIYAYVNKDPKKALDYLNSEKIIKDNLMSLGLANYYWNLGMIFRYGNMPDSGLYYLRLAEPNLIRDIGNTYGKLLYVDMAVCYQLKNNQVKAIYYYEKFLEQSKKKEDWSNLVLVSDSLSKLYHQIGDYKKAYEHKLRATVIGDSLGIAAKGKDLVLLDLVRENKKFEDNLRQEKERLNKKRNLQYMGIIIGICVVFLAFLVLGMFPVSKLVIRIFGFIYFICVFEFIILLIEHSVLHPITHGDPLKLWACKIVLIALLVPFQQFLEHRLIHFLQSRKLHHVRTKLIGKKWWQRKKPVLQAEIVEEKKV